MSESVARRRPMIDLEEFERRLRQPSAQNRKEDEALSELARLSNVAEEDPYKAMFEPAPAQGSVQEPAWDQEWEPRSANSGAGSGRAAGRADFAAIQAGLLGSLQPGVQVPQDTTYGVQEYAEEAYYQASSYQPAYPHEQGTANLWPYEEVVDPSAPEESSYGGHSFDEPRSRRPLYITAGIILAGLIGIGASFTFKSKVADLQEVSTIMADSGPTKIQPSTPANSDNVTQDASILDKTASSAPAALAGHQEQPVDLSQAQIRDAQAAPLAAPSTVAAASVPVPPAPPLPPQQTAAQPQARMPSAPQQPLSIASLIEPKKVKTVSVRPDGTLLPNDTPPQTAAPAVPAPRPPAPPAVKAATPKSTARVTPKDAAAAAGNGTASMQSTANSAAKVKPAQVASAAPEAAEAGSGGFAVQFAAPTSEQEARDIQIKLGRQYAAALAGRHTSIRKAISGEKTVYRVRVGGLTREEATSMCQHVQGAGGNCFVAKN